MGIVVTKEENYTLIKFGESSIASSETFLHRTLWKNCLNQISSRELIIYHEARQILQDHVNKELSYLQSIIHLTKTLQLKSSHWTERSEIPHNEVDAEWTNCTYIKNSVLYEDARQILFDHIDT